MNVLLILIVVATASGLVSLGVMALAAVLGAAAASPGTGRGIEIPGTERRAGIRVGDTAAALS
jgi:hypothetical protein